MGITPFDIESSLKENQEKSDIPDKKKKKNKRLKLIDQLTDEDRKDLEDEDEDDEDEDNKNKDEGLHGAGGLAGNNDAKFASCISMKIASLIDIFDRFL